MAKVKGAAERLLAAGWTRVPIEQRGDLLEAMWVPPGRHPTQDREELRVIATIPPNPKGRTLKSQQGEKFQQLHVTAAWRALMTTPAAIAQLEYDLWASEEARKKKEKQGG